MKELAQQFLSEEEQRRVTSAVKEAERQTSGEIVPMIVSTSSDYTRARFAAALLYSLPPALGIMYLVSAYFWLPPENVYVFLCAVIPLFLLFSSLTRVFPVLSRPFISSQEMETCVTEEAVKAFFSERLYATREANGILVFISVFEKKVWILADYGIDEKIPKNTWESQVEDLTRGIRQNQRCQALCDTIASIGSILKEHFPYRRDDTDELHNLIIK